jgi:hypothetical protein
MTAKDKTAGPVSSAHRQARCLRITAAGVLLLGIFGADLVYWLGTRSVGSPDTLPVIGEDKAVTRQVEVLLGKQPILMEGLGRNLKRPGTQAVIIVVTAALVAGGCFYVARLLDHAGEHSDESGLPPD